MRPRGRGALDSLTESLPRVGAEAVGLPPAGLAGPGGPL